MSTTQTLTTQVTRVAVKKRKTKKSYERWTIKRPPKLSRPKKIQPVIGDGNTIAVCDPSAAIDVHLSINKLTNGSHNSPVDLMDGFDGRSFVALFDDKDTDFEIKVENQSPGFDIWMDITYGTKRSFVIKRRTFEVYDILEDCGHRLRFMTPNRPDGQSFADMYPAGEIDANTEIHIISNRVTIALKAGRAYRPKLSIGGKPKAKNGVHQPHPSAISVNARIKMTDQMVRVSVLQFQTVAQLKRLIAKKAGTELSAASADGKQRLVFDGKDLDDDQRVDETGLRTNSTVLVFSVRRGGDKVDTTAGRPPPPPVTKRLIYIKGDKVCDVKTMASVGVGLSGAVGYGDKTDEKFGPPLDFDITDEYTIESFDIDLRLKQLFEKKVPVFVVPSQ